MGQVYGALRHWPHLRTDERRPLDPPDNLYSPADSEDRTQGDFAEGARIQFYDWLEMRGGGSKLVLADAVGAALLAARAYTAKGQASGGALVDGSGSPIET